MTMGVHGGDWRKREDGYDYCNYCGSIRPQEAMRRLTTPGCKFSSTDKGGYKFYIDSEQKDFGKLYGAHLEDLTPEELIRWDEISRRVFGMTWKRDEKGLCWQSPKTGSFYGFQTWGIIAADGLPVFGDGSATPPDDEWWKRTNEKKS